MKGFEVIDEKALLEVNGGEQNFFEAFLEKLDRFCNPDKYRRPSEGTVCGVRG